MEFNLVACGGTFDHFHKGHRELLKLAFSLGKKVIVGVTSDNYLKGSKFKIQHSKFVESYEKRKEEVLGFIKEEKVLDRVGIVEINDLFGPTLSYDLAIDAIVVSESTKEGARTINKYRTDKGLPRLEMFILPMVLAKDGGEISSFRIRNGEIDREGRPYINPLWLKHKLLLTEAIKRRLEKPFGVIIKDLKELPSQNIQFVITVGDVTTKKFNDLYLKQNIAVVDFKVGRKIMFSRIEELGFSGIEIVVKINNLAGCLTPDIFKGVRNALKQGLENRIIIKIEGEEDLSVLPLVLASPLNCVVFYGQPNEGIVRVVVSEEIKKIAYGLVDGFEMLK
ncbi:MAG: pantetheine-phosphate adenylyltransferase [Candidatus Levybacteria bacterium]|nr:pantetheine-phosphate adenylyltransferase [Candidatus Levybacteria bacterium]